MYPTNVKLSVFLEEFKIAKLKPLLKRDSKTNPKNCKRVSLLPLVSKFIKKLIHYQLEDYLKENGLLCKYQSGVRANFSTDSCLAQLKYFVLTGMDKGMHTGMISIDLQKAFDTLDHKIVLEKMTCLDLKTPVINWFESYL